MSILILTAKELTADVAAKITGATERHDKIPSSVADSDGNIVVLELPVDATLHVFSKDDVKGGSLDALFE